MKPTLLTYPRVGHESKKPLKALFFKGFLVDARHP